MKQQIEFVKTIPCHVIDLSIDDFKISSALLGHVQDVMKVAHEAKVIVIRGSDKIFCRGLDLSVLDSDIDDAYINNILINFRKVISLISNSPIPVIAKVDGDSFGGGLGIICAADVVIMSSSAQISLPETILGIIPAMIFPYIVRRLTPAKAKLLSLGTKPLLATQALNLGLADELAEDTSLILNKYVKRLSCIDAIACKEFKKLYNSYYGVKENDYYLEASNIFVQLAQSENVKNRIRGYLDGISPWE